MYQKNLESAPKKVWSVGFPETRHLFLFIYFCSNLNRKKLHLSPNTAYALVSIHVDSCITFPGGLHVQTVSIISF